MREIILLLVCIFLGLPCISGYNATLRQWVMPQGQNLTLFVLDENPFGAKCLDGSPPGYFFRPGVGSGAHSWHVYLPGGGWCTSLDDCAARAQTALGSTRPWTPRRKSAQHMEHLFQGILSGSRGSNPGFADWNLVVPVYCDGGGYGGRAGARPVNSSSTIYLDGWRIVKAIMSGARCAAGRAAQALPDGYGALHARVCLQHCLWYAPFSLRDSLTPRVPAHPPAFPPLPDLMDRRGISSASQVLLSGCSAGGQAVGMLCDQVETLLPRADVKCLMDAGFFMDAKDRTDALRFRSLAKQLASFHQSMGHPRCGRAHNASERWRCFFPQYALRFISSSVFIVNTLFDYAALRIGNQLPDKTTHIHRCLDDVVADLPRVTSALHHDSWRDLPIANGSACKQDEWQAVLGVAGEMLGEVRQITEEKRRVSAYLVDKVAHCTTVFASWAKLEAAGAIGLRSAITRWYFDSNQSDRFYSP
eukprot:TRINITY_DN2780_c0_g1_i2.p1 TRINITY_DN2780_c0_g1~~TRINITY_DN2780_c0_g1_i2.p1  ORF type:complete len:475 (+),score=-30.02 TRINITY_DN2780_c0_g1_i2:118-1542(+)